MDPHARLTCIQLLNHEYFEKKKYAENLEQHKEDQRRQEAKRARAKELREKNHSRQVCS